MTSESEKQPHVVHPKDIPPVLGVRFESYLDAFAYWSERHDVLKHPYKITVVNPDGTFGRGIDPDPNTNPIIGCAE